MTNNLEKLYNLTQFEEVIKSSTAISIIYLLAAQGDQDTLDYIERYSEAVKARDFQEQYSTKGDTEAKAENKAIREKHYEKLKAIGTPGQFLAKKNNEYLMFNMSKGNTTIANPFNQAWTKVYFLIKLWAAKARLQKRYGVQLPATSNDFYAIEFNDQLGYGEGPMPKRWWENPWIQKMIRVTEEQVDRGDGFTPFYEYYYKVYPFMAHHQPVEGDAQEYVKIDFACNTYDNVLDEMKRHLAQDLDPEKYGDLYNVEQYTKLSEYIKSNEK